MFQLIGKVTVFYFVVRVLYYAWTLLRLYVLPKCGMKRNLRKFGEWAVVTGATDGIGKEYARQLAKKGLKIVLVSRSQNKLDNVAEEIKKEFKVDVKTIAFDFDNTDGYEKIASDISGLEIGVLVNNVGMSYEFPDYFCDVDIKEFEKMVRINCFSMLKMTHLILPGMRDRKNGLVINVSSAAALRPMPLLGVYSAAKSFVDVLSQAIQVEYKKSGIICQAVLPYFVTTKLSAIKKPSALVPTPEQFVASQLGTVGYCSRVSGFLAHALQSLMTTLPPSSFFSSKALEIMQHLRIKALRKRKVL